MSACTNQSPGLPSTPRPICRVCMSVFPLLPHHSWSGFSPASQSMNVLLLTIWPLPPFRSSNAHGPEQVETTLLDSMQLGRGGSSCRGSLILVQMLVRREVWLATHKQLLTQTFLLTRLTSGLAGGRHLVQQHADPWLWFPDSTKLLC